VKIVIFTRTGFHHTSFINRLQERFEVVCVVREAYPELPKKNTLHSALRKLFRKNAYILLGDEKFLRKFSEKYSAGFRYHPMLKHYLKAPFDVVAEKPGIKYLTIGCGEINSPELRDYLKPFSPDVIAVLGNSVLKSEVISLPSVAMINIHSGLSPYYRGTWSYGWPIVNSEPEYIGVTLHHINTRIDNGAILYQTRPLLEKNDDLNSIFLKVISEGIELMVKAIEEFSDKGNVPSYTQPEKEGKLYQMKDFNADTARACLKNLEKNIVGEYLLRKEARDSQVKLFGYTPPVLFQ
jgi:folate-dependent phosphoribosylglycinamide formyltransferase PurN